MEKASRRFEEPKRMQKPDEDCKMEVEDEADSRNKLDMRNQRSQKSYVNFSSRVWMGRSEKNHK